MRQIILVLDKQHDKLIAIVEQRENTFDGRSDDWQESDKAAEYEEKTDDIRSQADELEYIIDALKETM